jgi:cytochrome o ubiquinol oxidase subunit 1
MLPKNSSIGLIIGGFAFCIGFGLIWHMWWLATVGLLGVIICVIVRCSNDNVEYELSAAELEKLDKQYRRQRA